tara:strand:- start:166550 stop:167185 length:636 start_codon:yes stop_codon:yes gene_type:complete
MNVNEIRDRILEISHDEVAPDTNLKIKSLNWLNSAYHEIIGVCMPFLERYIEAIHSVDIMNGVGTLPTNTFRVLTVVDKNNGYELTLKTRSEIIKQDASLNNTGAATYYWVDGNDIHTYPLNNTSVNVSYLKHVEDLLDGGTELDILIPKQFHHGLVWGGLVWSSVFERGFSSQGDLKMFQEKWEDVKREVKLSLSSQSSSNLKVKSFDLV